MHEPKNVAAVGECMIELSADPDGRWHLGYAGDTFNALWTMRALLPSGVTCDYVSAFGDDPFSARQIGFFADNGIGTAASPRIAGARPGLYAITLDGHERSFTYWRSDSAARRLADDETALSESFAGRDLVLFSGITLAVLEPAARDKLIAALATARTAETRIAFDPNYRPRLWTSPDAAREANEKALSVADIALPTFPDEAELYGDTSPDSAAFRIASSGVDEIVVKNGTDPALVGRGGLMRPVAAMPSPAPVDTTGAGDAFNGAYLAARLLGHDPVAAAGIAHRVAARCVETRGALVPPAAIVAAAGDLQPA